MGDVAVAGECGPADGGEVNADDDVVGSRFGGEGAGGVEFDPVALAVGDGQGDAVPAFAAGRGETGGRIETSAEEDDGSRRRWGGRGHDPTTVAVLPASRSVTVRGKALISGLFRAMCRG